jgi:hypothetical protein
MRDVVGEELASVVLLSRGQRFGFLQQMIL